MCLHTICAFLFCDGVYIKLSVCVWKCYNVNPDQDVNEKKNENRRQYTYRKMDWFRIESFGHYIIIIDYHWSKYYLGYAMKNVLIYQFEQKQKKKREEIAKRLCK